MCVRESGGEGGGLCKSKTGRYEEGWGLPHTGMSRQGAVY